MFVYALDHNFKKGKFFKIFCDPQSHAGAIIVFYDQNKADASLRDMSFMLVNCTDTQYTLCPEDVVAQLILKNKLVTDGKKIYLEWKNDD